MRITLGRLQTLVLAALVVGLRADDVVAAQGDASLSMGSQSTEEPTTVEPITEKPTTPEPSTAEPTTEQSTSAEPSITEPTTEQSTSAEPSITEPTTEQATSAEPSITEPTAKEPSTAEPTTKEQSTNADSTPEPSSQSPTTEMPTTVELSAGGPSTSAPSGSNSSTADSSTQEPTTAEPTTTFVPPQNRRANARRRYGNMGELPSGKVIKDLPDEFHVYDNVNDLSRIVANNKEVFVLHPVQTKGSQHIYDPFTIGQVLGYIYELAEFGPNGPPDGFTIRYMGRSAPSHARRLRNQQHRRAVLTFKKKKKTLGEQNREI